MATDNKGTQTPEDAVATMIDTGPTVMIAGQVYTMRRLGLADTFKLAKVVAVGAASVGQAVKLDFSDEDKAGQSVLTMLVAGIPYAQQQVLELLADIIGVKASDLEDTERFPMEAILDIIEGLMKHQDLMRFFARLGGLMNSPMMKTVKAGSATK